MKNKNDLEQSNCAKNYTRTKKIHGQNDYTIINVSTINTYMEIIDKYEYIQFKHHW